jgi:hypothetical protein
VAAARKSLLENLKGEIMPLRCTPPSVSSWINRLAVALPGALNSLSPDEDLQKFAKI